VKIHIGIATINSRADSLQITLQSLMNQTVKADSINVYNNDDDELPDLTDNAKFFPAINADGIYFACDDDLLYPPDYIERTVTALSKYPKHILTYHGRKLTARGVSYYRHNHKVIRCLGYLHSDTFVDVGGSGVAAWRTDSFDATHLHRHPNRMMADLVMSQAAAMQGIKIMCLAHNAGWIQHNEIDMSQTIFRKCRNNDAAQSEIADSIWNLNNCN
jgi:hypothetical protein